MTCPRSRQTVPDPRARGACPPSLRTAGGAARVVNGITTGLTSGQITLGPSDTWAIVYTAVRTVTRQLLAA